MKYYYKKCLLLLLFIDFYLPLEYNDITYKKLKHYNVALTMCIFSKALVKFWANQLLNRAQYNITSVINFQ